MPEELSLTDLVWEDLPSCGRSLLVAIWIDRGTVDWPSALLTYRLAPELIYSDVAADFFADIRTPISRLLSRSQGWLSGREVH